MNFEMIGAKMKNRRLELSMSLADVAKKLDTSPSVIRRWENGDTPSIKTTRLKEIAIALNTTVEYLLNAQPSFVPLEGIMPVSDPTMGELSYIVKDEAMSGSRIRSGDEVYIRRVSTFEDGQILAIKYQDDVIVRPVRAWQIRGHLAINKKRAGA